MCKDNSQVPGEWRENGKCIFKLAPNAKAGSPPTVTVTKAKGKDSEENSFVKEIALDQVSVWCFMIFFPFPRALPFSAHAYSRACADYIPPALLFITRCD